jgi:hypothetical protein
MLLVFLKNHTLTTTHFMTLNSILLLVLLICCKKTNKTAIPECVPYEHIKYKPYKLPQPSPCDLKNPSNDAKGEDE